MNSNKIMKEIQRRIEALSGYQDDKTKFRREVLVSLNA